MRAEMKPMTARAAPFLMAVVAVAVLSAPPAAWAHSRLVQTSPATSATVTAPVSEVTLTFNEHVHQQFSVVVVRGPAGASYSDGHVRVVDDVVHQPVYPLKSGGYTVEWRVVSADAHPVQGSFGFTVTLPADLEPSAGPSSPAPKRLTSGADDTGAGSWWPWLLGAVAVGVVATLAARYARRRRGRTG
jgi:copper resistance protein C